MPQDPSVGPSVDRPQVSELTMSCFAWAGGTLEKSASSFHSCSRESYWWEAVVVARWQPAAALG
jgi:hypothetical protein